MKKQLLMALGIATLTMLAVAPRVQAADTHTNGQGASTAMSAYYDDTLFTIHFSEFSSNAEESLLAHNKSINFIYQYDPGLPNGDPFISVIDAVPGDGFNPLWEEVQIIFTKGNTPHQFFSDNEVLEAVFTGEIVLDFTGEVYWCPVVGKKN